MPRVVISPGVAMSRDVSDTYRFYDTPRLPRSAGDPRGAGRAGPAAVPQTLLCWRGTHGAPNPSSCAATAREQHLPLSVFLFICIGSRLAATAEKHPWMLNNCSTR
jgi:hypothetical protein